MFENFSKVGKYVSPLWQIQMINECMQCVHQQFKPMGVGRNQLQCIGHPPAEIWFAQWEIQDDFVQEILVPKKSSCSAPDQLSSWAAVARWRGGEGCSVPATHQIGRSTVSNILGNSWSLPIHTLRVVWNFSLQWCRRLSPPFWLRLDCRHCRSFLLFISLLFCCVDFNVRFNMNFKTLFPIWGKVAYIAFVGFLFLMWTRMFSQWIYTGRCKVTLNTLVWFLSSMFSHMLLQMDCLREC